jgi:lipopolysaccharide biosynthesis protein
MTRLIGRNWNYAPSCAPLWYKMGRLKIALTLRRGAPESIELKPPSNCSRWTLYFTYLPSGQLDEAHRFTIAKLRDLDRNLMVVCAAPSPNDVPFELIDKCDAIYWKSLDGFDFSGYSIGLNALAKSCPYSDVFVMNDSVLGPFGDIGSILNKMNWEITGFTASSQYENHIQSYAFVIKNISIKKMKQLDSIFSTVYSYNDIWTVVSCFETRFARVAARHMTVGSLWFGPRDGSDPTVDHAISLLADGFPFVKRSLFGKHSDRQDKSEIETAIARFRHPVPPFLRS